MLIKHRKGHLSRADLHVSFSDSTCSHESPPAAVAGSPVPAASQMRFLCACSLPVRRFFQRCLAALDDGSPKVSGWWGVSLLEGQLLKAQLAAHVRFDSTACSSSWTQHIPT